MNSAKSLIIQFDINQEKKAIQEYKRVINSNNFEAYVQTS